MNVLVLAPRAVNVLTQGWALQAAPLPLKDPKEPHDPPMAGGSESTTTTSNTHARRCPARCTADGTKIRRNTTAYRSRRLLFAWQGGGRSGAAGVLQTTCFTLPTQTRLATIALVSEHKHSLKEGPCRYPAAGLQWPGPPPAFDCWEVQDLCPVAGWDDARARRRAASGPRFCSSQWSLYYLHLVCSGLPCSVLRFVVGSSC